MARGGIPDSELKENQRQREQYGYAPNPLCQVCHGSGWVHPLKYDMTPDYASAIPCKAKDCVEQSKRLFQLTKQSLIPFGITERLQTFDSFQVFPETEISYSAFYDLAHGKTRKPFILCYGGIGCGKTHLCQAITKVLNRRGVTTYYYQVPNLISRLKEKIETKDIEHFVDYLCKVNGLVLDDFGSDPSEWGLARLQQIIDNRWTDKKITVLTTNKGLPELDEFCSRIYSRMCDTELSAVVFNGAKDYRTTKMISII
jgi:DNA replication protein DnaC